MDKFRQIQENLFDYFKDVDDTTFAGFVDSFAYFQPAKSSKVSKLAEKFIEDNGLFDALADEKYDKDEGRIFSRSSMSATGMLEQIRSGLLSLSYNRFRNLLNLTNKKIRKVLKNSNEIK